MFGEKGLTSEKQTGKGQIINFPDKPRVRKLTSSRYLQPASTGEEQASRGFTLNFLGYACFEAGCPVCGCQELEVYALSHVDQSTAVRSVQAAKDYQHRVCSECGLHEEYFVLPLAYQLTGQLLVSELERVTGVISRCWLITQPQQWLALRMKRVQEVLELGTQTFKRLGS
jgi:predicted nucleic-acid-binding Zn-ribbon protein